MSKTIKKPKPFKNPCKVVKSLRDECDLNKIYERYCAGEALPIRADLQYGDTTITVDSYVEATNIVKKVRSDFESLPSNIRAEFGNNPMDFVEQYNKALIGDIVAAVKMNELKIIDFNQSVDVPTSGSVSSLISGSDTKNAEQAENAHPETVS